MRQNSPTSTGGNMLLCALVDTVIICSSAMETGAKIALESARRK